MDQDTQSWLVGVPFDTNHGMPHERIRLSPRHKWELANLTGFVMASTVFFLTPLLVSAPAPDSPDAGSRAGQVEVPESAREGQPAVHIPVVPVSAGLTTPSAPTRDVATPAVRASRLTIPRKSSTQAQAFPRTTTSVRPAVVRAVTAAPASPQFKERDRRRKGFSSSVKRLLVGSGRHRVQPFPTPD